MTDLERGDLVWRQDRLMNLAGAHPLADQLDRHAQGQHDNHLHRLGQHRAGYDCVGM
jgi:hypothetical protein